MNNIHLLKGISLSFCIVTSIMFPLLFSNLDISNLSLDNRQDSDDMFVTSVNGKKYLAKYITTKDIDTMKQNLEILQTQTEAKSNLIIDGHGTGYSVPTSEDLDSLLGKLTLIDALPEIDEKYQATADLSSEIYFPAVGDQGNQGSCSAWANAYYAYGYLEAKDYGWDASSGNPDYLLSPAWAYNIVAASDYGSIPYEVVQVLLDWGVPTLSAMPYDDSDVNSWGDETAWRQAPYHRPLSYTLISYTGTATIDLIKSLIDAGTPVTIGIDAYQFYNGLDQSSNDYILSSAEYIADQGLNHAQCLVGYDDAITEGNDVGAFRVVNSWGASWMDGGYYWLTYDAFSKFADDLGQVIMYISDRIDYSPDLIATWEFSLAPTRMGDIITLGAGSYSNPLDSKTPYYDYDSNNMFPDFMAFDISDFFTYYIANNDEFFFLKIGSSINTGIISSFLIERYTAGVLDEITLESIDVPQTTPGYVRNTFMEFDHEIGVSLETPMQAEFGTSYLINATVSNIGINDESNIELYLYLNGGVVNSITYPNLTSGTSETINFLWTPMIYDTFNFTVFSPPVVGEYFEDNNFLSSLVTVRLLLNYTMTAGYPYIWIDASSGEELYLGDDGYAAIPLPFDFKFYDQEFSTVYLCSNGYLSFSDDMPWEYNNTPFPSGNILHHYMMAPFWDDLYPPSGGYIYVQDFGDHWVAEWMDIYHTGGSLVGSFEVVLYDTGDIVFNYDYLDYTSGGYTCGLNLGVDIRYYNYYQGLSDSTDDFSLKFTREHLDHDISVSLETPMSPEIGNSYIINATMKNIGLNDEYDVELFLYLDNVQVAYSTIPTLIVGMEQTIQYTWTANDYGSYEFKAITPPVPNELNILDNSKTKFVYLIDTELFDGLYINHKFNMMGSLYGSTFTYNYFAGRLFHETFNIEMSGMPIQSITWNVDALTRLMSGGSFFGDGAHTPAWIFNNVSLYDSIPIAVDGEGDHIFNVTRDLIYDLPGYGLIGVWELEDLTTPGGTAFYEKSTGILLDGNFFYGGGAYSYSFDFIDTNIVFENIVFDHDLHVSLETPLTNNVDETYVINATVKNNGINDEYNVGLFLYLDGLEVASATFPTLSAGMEQTIQYTWNPTEYGDYNFTAYAPAVPFESYIENNIRTKMVSLFETELFNGLYIKHTFSQDVYTYNTNFTYTLLEGSIYQESLGLAYTGLYMTYTWQVDALTRIMSGGSVFRDGAHTNAWIFTNTSLHDLIPIASDGEGDHIFKVTRDLIYDLPGFGPVGVWELKDLTQPGGIAWYEKSTGILLKGTFFFANESYSYEFNFIDTNAELKTILPPSTFTLSSTATNPDTDGNFDLDWTESQDAITYSIYRHRSFITEINENLTLIAYKITDLSLALSGYSNGDYYFIVVAHNDQGDTLSNCIKVTVQKSSSIIIPGYDLWLIIGLSGIVIFCLFKKKLKIKT